MHFILALVFCIINTDLIIAVSEVPISNITDILTALLNNATNARIEELRAKLATINKYAIDGGKLEQLLMSITKDTKLKNTNFFKSLSENDQYRFLIKDDTKNLYLKLKERMNRDDVLSVLAGRGNRSEAVKSAEEDLVNDVVDKMIAADPVDDHKFDAKDNESIYWDPQGELEDLRDFHQQSSRRIFKGERTTVRHYPFMASVHVMGRFWCGGVVYWHDLVLTSAACLQLMHNNRFFRENPKVLQVRVGSNHSRVGGEVIDALEVYFHPSYNPKSLRHNIAVVRLRRHLYFNYHRTPKVIAISRADVPMPTTAEVLLLGWGVTKMSQKMAYEPIFLQRKFLPVYPNSFCKEVYGDKFITNTMFCAGTLTTGEGACDHDAGGPAILSGKLVGIISFGATVCGFPSAPTVFTLVGAYADWIESVNETMPGYYRGNKRTTTSTRSPLVDFFDTWEPYKTEPTTPGVAPFVSGAPVRHGAPDAPGQRSEPPAVMRLRYDTVARGLRDDETDDGWSIGD